ncbi:hypothetical protein MMC10_008964 [Thelotrema lepadinum]|nr:hypothetical protein [Thelotrema lepadinum]
MPWASPNVTISGSSGILGTGTTAAASSTNSLSSNFSSSSTGPTSVENPTTFSTIVSTTIILINTTDISSAVPSTLLSSLNTVLNSSTTTSGISGGTSGSASSSSGSTSVSSGSASSSFDSISSSSGSASASFSSIPSTSGGAPASSGSVISYSESTPSATSLPATDSGAVSSSTSPLTTFTVFPSQTVNTITDTTFSSGSHIDTTVTDDTGPHVTHIPVLPDSNHGCWFCPPGFGGFSLPGFSLPGVYPPGGPPPGFDIEFPSITIDGNGDPSFESEPTQNPTSDPASASSNPTSASITSTASQTTSCITEVVTDCSSVLSFGVNTDGSTTTTQTITSCAPRTGCSLTATAVTSSVTSSQVGCWSYDYNVDTDPDPDDESDDSLDASEGIVRRHALENVLVKRAGKDISALDTCTLSFVNGPNTAATSITIPDYPPGSSLEAHVPSGAVFWFVPTTTAAVGACPTLTITQYPNIGALTAAPVLAGQPVYQFGRKPPAVNVDHVWELKFMKNFFTRLLQTGEISCADLNSFFMAANPLAGSNVPRLQTLWNQVPQNDFPDFAGMDLTINAVKGQLFNPNLQGLANAKTDDAKLQQIWQIAVAVDTTNHPNIAPVFKRTNVRIYEAFRGIDALVASSSACGQPAPTPSKSTGKGWADVYSDYMVNLLSTQNTAISSKLASATSNNYFTSTADSNGNLNSIGKGVAAFTSAYPTNKWAFDAGALLDFPTTSSLAIQRRDGPVCSLGTSTPGSASASATDVASTASVSASATPSASPSVVISASTDTPSPSIVTSSDPGSASSSTPIETETPTPVPSTTEAPAPPSTTTQTPPDMSSPTCIDCTNALGASNCAPDDDTCLVNQCKADTNCQQCGIDCDSFATTSTTETPAPPSTTAEPSPSPTPEPSPSTTPDPPPSTTTQTPPDMSSPACVSCVNAMGASDCAPDDNTCLVDQCQADTDCQQCGVDCNSFVSG